MDDLIGTKLGNYRLERQLGRGRMGVVYLARDEALLRPTAVKILAWAIPESYGQNPEAWFIAEARNVARINHPHVVQIYGVARHGSYCYIAMEYVDGTTADVWVSRHGPFTAERATDLLIQTCSALQAAHDANVIHRDIKPENLLLGADGKAKLGDFGMALYTPKPHAAGIGRAGTPYYTAPELWRGDMATAASDIYALGATYFYLLTGRPPFVAQDLQELIALHISADIPSLQAIRGNTPPGCQELLRRCMAKSAYDRFPSAQAVGWEARMLLRRATSSRPAPAAASLADATRHSVISPSSRAERANKTDALGRTNQSSHHGSRLSTRTGFFYQGEPFASVLTELTAPHRSVECQIQLLIGQSGTGRSTIAREVVSRLLDASAAALVSCGNLTVDETLVARASRAFGIPGSAHGGLDYGIDALVEHCLSLQQGGTSPLLVLDDCERVRDTARELGPIAMAAQLSTSFRLLLVGDSDFETQLRQSFVHRQQLEPQIYRLSALEVAQVNDYVRLWLDQNRLLDATRLLLTPDAVLVVAHRSQGILSHINELLGEMLSVAASGGRKVLDSWDAWNALSESGCAITRPKDWPTPEAKDIINSCRSRIGLRPRR